MAWLQVAQRRRKHPPSVSLEQAAPELFRAFVVYKGAAMGATAAQLQEWAAARVALAEQSVGQRINLIKLDSNIAQVPLSHAFTPLCCASASTQLSMLAHPAADKRDKLPVK
jgi:hypothetical protein